jgi:hypothetical protein
MPPVWSEIVHLRMPRALETFDVELTHYLTAGLNQAQTAAIAAIRAGLGSVDLDAALQQAQRLYDGLLQALPRH